MMQFLNFIKSKLSAKNNDSVQDDKTSLVRFSKRGAKAMPEVAKGKKIKGKLVTDPRITCIISQRGIELFSGDKPLK